MLLLSGAEPVPPCKVFFIAHPAISTFPDQWEVINGRAITRMYDSMDEHGHRQSTIIVFNNGKAVAYEETLQQFVEMYRHCHERLLP